MIVHLFPMPANLNSYPLSMGKNKNINNNNNNNIIGMQYIHDNFGP